MKNRRFQFRLRTLMIVMTIMAMLCPLGVWLAREGQIVPERKIMREWIGTHGAVIFEESSPETLPWIRRIIGDRTVNHLVVIMRTRTTDGTFTKLRTVFPEAKIGILWDVPDH
jgi:hypothetical protein